MKWTGSRWASLNAVKSSRVNCVALCNANASLGLVSSSPLLGGLSPRLSQCSPSGAEGSANEQGVMPLVRQLMAIDMRRSCTSNGNIASSNDFWNSPSHRAFIVRSSPSTWTLESSTAYLRALLKSSCLMNQAADGRNVGVPSAFKGKSALRAARSSSRFP
eukprot:2948297-Prymnesium_polylepis.1